MADRPMTGLDNPAFRGRLRQTSPVQEPLAGGPAGRNIDGVHSPDLQVTKRQFARPSAIPVSAMRTSGYSPMFPVGNQQPTPFTPDSVRELERALKPVVGQDVQPPHIEVEVSERGLFEQPVAVPVYADPEPQPAARPYRSPAASAKSSVMSRLRQNLRANKLQTSLVTMACFLFAGGAFVSIQAALTNQAATTQIASISKKVDSGATDTSSDGDTPPSTTKPSKNALSSYSVAPDLAKIIRIPSIGVNARVLQVGVKTDGSLGTPSNVYDTAWYTGSAKPGQPGATLIDGHVSSWTTHGVFYSIKDLKAGDAIQIVKGDGSLVNYQVAKVQSYDADNVDMAAAMKPIEGTSGLNLITCTGQVVKGTNHFDKRVIVFAKQV